MIQEILILWAVFLMTVNEAFYEPDFFFKDIQGNHFTIHTNSSHKHAYSNRVSVKHLRIKSAACRRLLALLRAFIPRHPDWITITTHTQTHTCIY